MRNFGIILALTALLGACATPDQQAEVRYGTPVRPSPSLKPQIRRQTVEPAKNPNSRTQQIKGASVSLATAATAPLDDFNLRRPVAPEALEDILYIYEANPKPDCAAIARELYVLNTALNELDEDDVAIEKSKNQQRVDLASDTTLDVVRSTSSGLIPFSGVIRAATGARAAQQHYDSRYDRGRRRRAFLKGYALGIGCAAPVSPKTLIGPTPEPDEDYRSQDASTSRSNRHGSHR